MSFFRGILFLHTILLNIYVLNRSFWPIDGTLTSTTIPSHSRPGSKDNKWLVHGLQISRTGASQSNLVLCETKDTPFLDDYNWKQMFNLFKYLWRILYIYIYIYIYCHPYSTLSYESYKWIRFISVFYYQFTHSLPFYYGCWKINFFLRDYLPAFLTQTRWSHCKPAAEISPSFFSYPPTFFRENVITSKVLKNLGRWLL